MTIRQSQGLLDPENLPAIVALKVIPNAKRNEIVSWENSFLKVRIQATPDGGKANKALVAFLSDRAKIPKKNISIRRGHVIRQKWIAFDGIDLTALLNRLGIQAEPTHG